MMVPSVRMTTRLYLYYGLLLALQGVVLSSGAVYNPNGGPVYVDAVKAQAPAQAISPSSTSAQDHQRVTQTVYGFLDFTTTIGNTIMVFSPQSAPPPAGNPKVEIAEQTTQKQATTTTVIETKPPVVETPKPPTTPKVSVSEIKPSKPQASKPTVEKKPSPQFSSESKKSSTEIVKSQVIVKSEPKFEQKSGEKPVQVEAVASSVVEVREETRAPIVYSHVEVVEGTDGPPIASSKVEVVVGGGATITPELPQTNAVFSSVVEVRTSEDDQPDVPVVLNNIGEPEYDFLSRQPSQIVDESYRVIDLKRPPGGGSGAGSSPNKPQNKHRPGDSGKHRGNAANSAQQAQVHPTGLVTRLGGTVVKEGVTTVHETSVIGTYISGKYAQVLQSTSRVYQEQPGANKPRPTPSNSGQPRILKTAAPHLHGQQSKNTKQHQHHQLQQAAEPSATGPDGALPLEALFQGSSGDQARLPRRPAVTTGSGGSFKNRLRAGKNQAPTGSGASGKQFGSNQDSQDNNERQQDIAPSATKKNGRRTTQGRYNNRFGRTSTAELATVSVFTESPQTTSTRRQKSGSGRYGKSNNNQNNQQQSNPISESATSTTRRTYKPRPTPSGTTSEHQSAGQATEQATSLYKFKLNRAPGRWQYKTTPKPRVTIRKQQNNDADLHPAVTPPTPALPDSPDAAAAISEPHVGASNPDTEDLESSSSQHGPRLSDDVDDTADNAIDDPFPIETVKIAISTPADFQNVYFEIATIKSPYTFQVGTLKNTRYVTVTSTYEKFLIEPTSASSHQAHQISATGSPINPSEPLTEDILATATNQQQHLARHLAETGTATLPILLLPSDVETPPLETLTETFSTAERVLKTHVLPVVRNASTSRMTLVQTYDVTRLVTATKTLPPAEAYHFVPSRALTEFDSGLDEAGSELHLALDFSEDGDENERREQGVKVLPADLDLAQIGSDFDLSDVDKSDKIPPVAAPPKPITTTTPAPPRPIEPQLTPEQLQQLALLRFLNPAAVPQQPQQQLITSTRPVVKLETVYESHVIPLFDGSNTIHSTISRPVATLTRTDYEVVTSTTVLPQPVVPTVLPQPQQLFPQLQQHHQFQVTSTPIVTQTVVTATESKVLKLTFGAKTAYTTLYSTRIVPTLVTTYLTASVPFVQPTQAAFPGYFPAPYPAYQFVG